MFFDWKIQLEKVQLTGDLKDDTILYQRIRLPCKNDQGYCDPTTHTQATIVWFLEETCTIFQVAKIHARMIKFHQKYFIESIPFEDVSPDQIRNVNHKFKNIYNIVNKLTRFQIYPEKELACKYNKPLYKTQYSEFLVEYDNGFDMNTVKLIIHQMARELIRFSKISKKSRKNRWKIKTTRYRKYTFTRTITHEQHIFWRNSL